MKDYGIDKGLIQYMDDSERNKRGWKQRLFFFRKMFRDYLKKLNVVFFDACCEDSSEEGIYPVRYNSNLGRLEYFNGTVWGDITEVVETTTTTTTSTTTSSTTTTTTSP